MLTIITEKRPASLYVPPLEDVARVFKRIRMDVLPAAPAEIFDYHGQPRTLSQPGRLANIGVPSLAHCVPHNFVPVVKLPLRVSDFFCDVKVDLTEKKTEQLDLTLAAYPPPKAPLAANATTSSALGAMVPIVYPPLPTIKRDLLMVMPEELENVKVGDYVYPVAPPLPFPPANYMPYPLIADQAPLAPTEVFALWLLALSYIPRADMVLASAAGSIFDLYAQAEAEGLTVQKLRRMVQTSLRGSDLDLDYGYESSGRSADDGLRAYMEFAVQVDTSDQFDPNFRPQNTNLIPYQSITRINYLKVAPKTSVDGQVYIPEFSLPLEYSTQNLTSQPDYKARKIFTDSSKELGNSVGSLKIRKEEQLRQNFADVNREFNTHSREIFNTKKRSLLKRLELLQSSKVFYTNDKEQIQDEELMLYLVERQAEMDCDLLRLKIQHTYDKLKVLMGFYQTSHRLYKTMNAVLVNKLKKLKNFLEHQKLVLDEAKVHKTINEGDITNIRSRESAKLFNSFVDQDYSGEIKEVFRCAILKDDGETVENDDKVEPAEFSKVYTNREHDALVDDYMPLVTESEFKLVTGEAPSKAGATKDTANKAKVTRHIIFQNPLYDYGTSGSDTNLSETPMPVKRRPGRRAAPKPAYGDESTKLLNDAALVAKIMKLFIGPAGATVDELSNDLGLIGIKTKWPLK